MLASPSGTDFLFDRWIVKKTQGKVSHKGVAKKTFSAVFSGCFLKCAAFFPVPSGLNERSVPSNLTNVLFDRHMEWLAFRERALPPSQIPTVQDGISETETRSQVSTTDDVQAVVESIVGVQLDLAKQVC